MTALFQPCTVCSWLKLSNANNVFIMKLVVICLAAIFFGALGGKREHVKRSYNY